LTTGLGRQGDAGHPPDLHAGQPDGGALDEPADLVEVGDQLVLPLEVARLRPEQVDDGEEGEQTEQDEAADPDLQREVPPVGHGQVDLSSPARKRRTSGLAERRISAGVPRSAKRPWWRIAIWSATMSANSMSWVTTMAVSHTPVRSWAMSSATTRALVGSRAAVGSAKNTPPGPGPAAPARATRHLL